MQIPFNIQRKHAKVIFPNKIQRLNIKYKDRTRENRYEYIKNPSLFTSPKVYKLIHQPLRGDLATHYYKESK